MRAEVSVILCYYEESISLCLFFDLIVDLILNLCAIIKVVMQGVSKQGKYQGLSFREFSRLRYKEIVEVSQLTEQEIVAKIIGEWNILQNGQDLQLGKHPSTPEKSCLEIDGPKGKSHVKTTAHKTEEQDQAIEKKEITSFELQDKPSIKKVGKRSGKIRDYITFYRFHSRRLVEAHSSWTSNQIAVIIKLLWRKEKIPPKRKPQLRKKTQRKMTGRTAFRIYKRKEGLSGTIINNLWRRLPLESKLAWKRRGNPNEKGIIEHNYTLSTCPAKRLQQLLGV